MSQSMHVLTLEILKAKYNLSELSNKEIHNAYRSIYSELLAAEKEYIKLHPGEKLLA